MNFVLELSLLNPGDVAYIVKINANDKLNHRLNELGFIKDQRIEVIAKSPLNDIIKYRILGYEISLRKEEADLIDVVLEGFNKKSDIFCSKCNRACINNQYLYHKTHIQKKEYINVLLIGNPNSGKTTLFNKLCDFSERVGNYSGVTVEAKSILIKYNNYNLNIIDLPGTYSLDTYSSEEGYVIKFITKNSVDVIVNVIDLTNIKLHLYLTTQLMDLNIPLLGALNMYDSFNAYGNRLNLSKLENILGFKLIPIIAKSKYGFNKLLNEIINITNEDHILTNHVYYGTYLENTISQVNNYLKLHNITLNRYKITKLISSKIDYSNNIFNDLTFRELILTKCRKISSEDIQNCKNIQEYIVISRYQFINEALVTSEYHENELNAKYYISDLIDKILLHKWLGIPICCLSIYYLFKIAFSIGNIFSTYIERFMTYTYTYSYTLIKSEILRNLFFSGIMPGITNILVFIPQIFMIYTVLQFLEDSGYISRVVFLVDNLMKKIGIHGKSFISLLLSFGCNVPAILSTRIIENKQNRLITALIIPFISCSARLPIYVMLTGVFFNNEHNTMIIICFYLLGFFVAFCTSKVLNFFIKTNDNNYFIMEMPPYILPNVLNISFNAMKSVINYLKKISFTIILGSILIWGLTYFPTNDFSSGQKSREESYMAKISKTICPIFKPMNFNWKLTASLLTGLGAKELTASSLSIMYDKTSYGNMKKAMIKDGIDNKTIISFLIFVLLYFPCLATLITIYYEFGLKISLFSVIYTTVIAWLISFFAYNVMSLLNF